VGGRVSSRAMVHSGECPIAVAQSAHAAKGADGAPVRNSVFELSFRLARSAGATRETPNKT